MDRRTHRRRAGVTVLGIHRKGAIEEGLPVLQLVGQARHRFFDLRERGGQRVFLVEGPPSREQFEGEHGDAVQVGARIDGVPTRLLGTHGIELRQRLV